MGSAKAKQRKYEPVVRIHAGFDKKTRRADFQVFESERSTQEEMYPDWNDQRYFLVREEHGHYLVMRYDVKAHPSHTPQIQPEILGIRHKRAYAVRLVESEVRKYARELMVKWGAKFLHPTKGPIGLKRLDKLWE